MSYLDADAELIRSCLSANTCVHDARSEWMSRREPGHKSVRHFDQLPPAVQAEDVPFVIAIRRAAEIRNL